MYGRRIKEIPVEFLYDNCKITEYCGKNKLKGLVKVRAYITWEGTDFDAFGDDEYEAKFRLLKKINE